MNQMDYAKTISDFSCAHRFPAHTVARGIAHISRFSVTDEGARFANIRATMRGNGYMMEISAGEYVRLHVGKELMMSDTPMERRTNYEFVRKAHGHVFVAGLGVGMIIHPILMKTDVLSVTIIEKHQDVIDLVAPTLAYDSRVRIVRGDVMGAIPKEVLHAQKLPWFDVVYFDIWPSITVDNLSDMSVLHRKWWRVLNRSNENRWMESWMRDYLIAERRRNHRYY